MYVSQGRDDDTQLGPLGKRAVSLTYTFFESFVYGGCIMGWVPLVYILKHDGIFSNLCQDEAEMFNATSSATPVNISRNGPSTDGESPTCAAQDTQLALVFTIAIIVIGVVGIPLGALFDRFGLCASKTLTR